MSWLPEPDPEATCLVTGASSGIGEAVARRLAAARYCVTLVARREDRLRALAEELEAAHGIRAEVITADLGDPGSRTELLTRVAEIGRRVDVLVNNAGFGSYGRFTELEPAREAEEVRVNCEAVVELTATYVPAMVERRSGAVLIVSSTLGFQPCAGYATYAATKAFDLYFGEALHTEVSGDGVAVTTLCPGATTTEFEAANGVQPGWHSMPRTTWTKPGEVAEAGLAGLRRNRRVVVPGIAWRAVSAGARFSPRPLQLRVMDRMFRSRAGSSA